MIELDAEEEVDLGSAWRRIAARWWLPLAGLVVGAALALMHGQPAQAWTLERLAHEVGLSRSVFADRFAHFMQDSPMHYLTRWRMQLATRLLERGIVVAPGAYLGEAGEGYVRVALVPTIEDCERAARIFEDAA